MDKKTTNNDLKISKTQKKKEMLELEKVGISYLKLNDSEIIKSPLSHDLKSALLEAKKIKSNQGLKRQKQYIGKLMRREPSCNLDFTKNKNI
tara:strand:+ start:295 stop:570 length:276 start_codon:yes stop_codon:yes gene_type:complete